MTGGERAVIVQAKHDLEESLKLEMHMSSWVRERVIAALARMDKMLAKKRSG
jgi:hypothetical protein